MPRGDGTGPNGIGPRTGRGMGYCAGYNTPGFMNSGFGRGMGRGLGFRRVVAQPMQMQPIQPVYPQQQYQPTKEQEIQMLEQESKAIEQEQKELNTEMTEIKKRVQELKSQK